MSALIQLYYFSLAALSGFSGFFLSFPLRLIKIKFKAIIFILDCLSVVLIAAVFIAFSYVFDFPDVNFYLIFGVGVGIFLYYLLAKLFKLCYNAIKERGKQNEKD